jgi:CheY-like chemotaxis protein
MMIEPRILIVDDDIVLLDLMIRRIKRMGLKADRAENGSDAMKLIDQNRYDLIVTDIYMSGASGLDLLKRAKEKDSKTQVVVITGGATIEAAVKALDGGAFSYLTKPFDHLRVFDNAVERALELRSLTMTSGQEAWGDSENSGQGIEISSEQPVMAGVDLEQLREIMEHFPSGIVVMNHNGEIIISNPAADHWLDNAMDSPQEMVEVLRRAIPAYDSDTFLNVRGHLFRIRARSVSGKNSDKSTLIAIDEIDDPREALQNQMAQPLEYLKRGLSWLFHQRMTHQEFTVIQTLAQQVTELEAFRHSLYRSNTNDDSLKHSNTS